MATDGGDGRDPGPRRLASVSSPPSTTTTAAPSAESRYHWSRTRVPVEGLGRRGATGGRPGQPG